MVNREHMEKWINALEAYDREPARGMLVENTGTEIKMCAAGIGLNAMKPGCLVNHPHVPAVTQDWHLWLGVEPLVNHPYDVTLKPDDGHFHSVVQANDLGKQSPWTIAQRLRETYLKEEEQP